MPSLANGLWKTLRHSKGVSKLIQEQLRNKLDNPRMQGLLDSMAESLARAVESNGEQIVLPKENPLMGLVLVARALMAEFPVLFIFENMHMCHSHQAYVFLQAVMKNSEKTRSMVIVQTEPINENSSMWMPETLLHVLRDNQFASIGLAPWTKEEVQVFLTARRSPLDPDLMLLWTDGRQECVAEVLDWTTEDLHALEAYQSKSLRLADSADPEASDRLVRLGALFGWRFPIRHVADMLKLEFDVAVDLLQQQSHLVEVDGDFAMFRRVLHQIRLFEDTIRTLPQAAGTAADNIYAFIGRSQPEYLSTAAKIYGKLERFTEAYECIRLLWDLDDDVLWLAMLEILIRWDIELPPYLMAPVWIRSSRYQFQNNEAQASTFQQRCLRWSMERDVYEVAVDVLRQGGRFFQRQGRFTEAEKQFLQSLEVVTAQQDQIRNADIRIDLLELYVSCKENRRAAEQLLLLEKLKLTKVQRIRLLGVHARLSQSEGNHAKAALLFLESRKLAAQAFKWGIATDSTLLAIEALLDDNNTAEARRLLDFIGSEVKQHDRFEQWENLNLRCRTEEEDSPS